MGYSDQKFYARPLLDFPVNPTDFSTFTAAGTASNSLASPAAAPGPFYKRPVTIGNIVVQVITAPNVNATPLVIAFVNGTTTFGTANVAAGTAGQNIVGVITNVALSTFTASSQITYGLVGTATASGGTGGKYSILVETKENFN